MHRDSAVGRGTAKGQRKLFSGAQQVEIFELLGIQAKMKEHGKIKRLRQKKIQLLLFLLVEELICLAATETCPEQSKGRDFVALKPETMWEVQ